ncbi:MAG TPA: polyphosphate kinase 1 [Anaerolineaceae bacterium]|nr:polyphosphate kinase 1 [Anaerolineaceae bacterium]
MDNEPAAGDRSAHDLNAPSNYLNRELGGLAFQRRVLEEARDPRNPLLERVRFLSILGSNLEEFYMVRVGSLKRALAANDSRRSMDGRTPSQQLIEIRKAAQPLMEEAQAYLNDRLIPQLDAVGIHILSYDRLNPQQREQANQYFTEVVFPVLTPLAFDPGHPFPHISNLSLNLAILIEGKDEQRHFVRVKIPSSLPYLVPVEIEPTPAPEDSNTQEHVFVWISQLIQANLGALFPGMKVLEAYPFHVTRNAEIEMQEMEADDLLETMEASVRRRRFGSVVRLLISPQTPQSILEILTENIDVSTEAIYRLNGPLVLHGLAQLCKIDRPDLKYPAFIPHVPPALDLPGELPDDSIFAAIRQQDILVHHPYDSFTPVIDFLRAAARDPDVLAIKQTLYRVGSNSPVVKALLQACRDYGKQVAVLVELKARFDEESNIGWARMLEQEGVHVTYGLLGLKTHSKIALVVRKEGDHIRRYVHMATGNYNHVTAQLYEDIGLFTCDDAVGADATDLFNYLTGYSLKQDYRKLLVAPLNLRQRLEVLVRREIEHQQRGEAGHLIFKANALVDQPMAELLYEASLAGVRVDLIIRGTCCLRPGVPGLSENIRVLSILGRFLEHSRIYYFRNAGRPEVLLGSADLMPRNLNQRVEVLFPVEDPRLIQHIHEDILRVYLSDNLKAREMQPDGTYRRLIPAPGESARVAQEWFLRERFHHNP